MQITCSIKANVTVPDFFLKRMFNQKYVHIWTCHFLMRTVVLDESNTNFVPKKRNYLINILTSKGKRNDNIQ